MNHQAKVWASVLIAAASVFAGCKKDAAKDDGDDTGTTTAVSSGGGGTTTGDNSTSLVADTTLHIGAVETQMVPASLATAETAQLALDGQGPCAGTAGFFDCQPIMIKMYLGIGKQMVGMTNEMVKAAGEALAGVAIPSTGSVTPNTGDIAKIDYSITSKTEFQLLLHSATGAFLHLDVKDNVYTLKGDLAKAPDADGTALLEAKITYADDDDFTVDVHLTNMACADEDVRAPGGIAVHIGKKIGVWQGKAMLHLPRFVVADGATCSTAATDATRMFLYTDFVGDKDGSTMSLFMLPAAATTTAAFAAYPASAFCTTFPAGCQNGMGFGDPHPVSTYVNPACVKADATTWGAACPSTNALISTPTYGAATDWLLPADFVALTTTVPQTLP